MRKLILISTTILLMLLTFNVNNQIHMDVLDYQYLTQNGSKITFQ